MEEGKKEYLQMLQEPICRMSTISAIFKGFAATICRNLSNFIFYNEYMDFGTFIFAGFSFCCFGCILFKVGKKI